MSHLTIPRRIRVAAILRDNRDLETAAIVARTGAPEALIRRVRREMGIAAPGTMLGACGTESVKRRGAHNG